jgi:hypothetical protein
VWCSSSFARPTIVNGKVYVPTYAFSTTGLPINPTVRQPMSVGLRGHNSARVGHPGVLLTVGPRRARSPVDARPRPFRIIT